MTPEPEVLDEIGQLYMNELEKLPLPDLDRMIKQVTAAKDTAALYLNALQSTLHSRLGGHAQQLRQEAGKSTGTVRFEVDGYMVVADLPKRPEYNQVKLKEAVEAEPARTLKTGKPSYKLEQIKAGEIPDAANDSHFGGGV
ncbi:MAG: hypothetical protein EBR49_18555 [Betaproteobacteria bacterium]|nr:hypothetical protein [Betaproteobacteria bacterium]